MKLSKPILASFAAALLTLWVAGCATGNVNPATARPNTGYADFRVDSSEALSWQVARQDGSTGKFTIIYSEAAPPAGGILRLAFSPGHYQLQVTFLNRVVTEPGLVELDVIDRKITPVQVALNPAGTTAVQRTEQRVGTTVKGYAGRKTKVMNGESVVYQVSVTAGTPVPYQPK